MLSRQLSQLEEVVKHERWRNEQLEKEVKAERKRVDKYVVEWSNACAKLAGQPKLFSEYKEPVDAVRGVDVQYTEAELEKFNYYAKMMRDNDIESGADAPPLSYYVEKIKENPNHYLGFVN